MGTVEDDLKAYSSFLNEHRGNKAAAYKSINEHIRAAADNEESRERLERLEAIRRFLEVAMIQDYMERHGFTQTYNGNISAWEWVQA